MASPNDPQDFVVPRTLASAGLPRRVRRILERTLALYSEELERNLVATMSEFEEELFRLAERSGTTGGGSMFDHMQTLRVVRLNRHDLVPRFMLALESGLAAIRTPQHLMPVPFYTQLLGLAQGDGKGKPLLAHAGEDVVGRAV